MRSCGVRASTAAVMNLHSAVSSSIRSRFADSSGGGSPATVRSPGSSWTFVDPW
jgi:hypothetical protein